jgi:hypothetical protein
MFGAFRITNPLSSGLLWKIPWRLSKFQKRRHRLRLRAVDNVVATVDAALAKKGQTLEALERWKAEMPTEAEMLPKDKYTMFDRKAKRYRKGIHSMSLCLDYPIARISMLTIAQNCPSGQGYPSESTLLVTRKAILQNWRQDNRVEDLTENGVFIPWRDLQADPHWDLCTTPMFHLRT